MDPASLERIKAFLRYLMEKDIEQGHVFSFQKDLEEKCQMELGAEDEKVKKALKENNYLCSCTSIEGTNVIRSDIYVLKRTEITAFDDTPLKFEKKILGSYDWLGKFKEWNITS